MAAFQFPDPSVQQTVVNSITGSTYQWKEPPGKWVVTVSVRKVEDIVYEGDNPPIPRGDYKLWYSTDTLELYFWYEDENGNGAWVPTSAPITMLEDLDEGLFEVRQDLIATNVAVRENENRIGRTIEYSDIAPTIYPETEVTTDIKDIDGITVIGQNTEYFFNELNYKFWYDTDRLELLVLYKDPDDGAYSYVPVSIPLESLPEPGVSTETFTYTTGRLQTAIEENYLHNLNQDTSISEIKNDIIELEEEIDAIAPSFERGTWLFNPLGSASSGQFAMYGVGTPTREFTQVDAIYINSVDSNGSLHSFSDVSVDSYVEVFAGDDADFGLYQIKVIHDETGGANSFWHFEVEHVRSNRVLAEASSVCRFKFFELSDGADGTSFVLKAGDEMTGPLKFESDVEVNDWNVPTGNEPRIEFKSAENDKSVLYKPTGTNNLVCSGPFFSSNLYVTNSLYGHVWKNRADGTRTIDVKSPRIAFLSDSNAPTDRNKDYGVLGFNNNDRLIWNKEGGNIRNVNGMVLEWNSSYGYLWLPKVGNTALTWGKDGVVVFRDSYGSSGTPGQVLTRTTDANYMQWATPATAGQALTNWDLVNSNNKNWGNEFYHNALTTGFGGYKSNGDEYNGSSNNGIFISDSMLEKLLKEDYPDKEIDIDKYVKYWTGEGTIELNTGSSGASGTSQTRTLTEVKRVNYNNDGRYPGVKFMWTSGDSLSFYSLYIKFVKTAGAFEDTGEVNTIQVPASNILYYTGSYTPSREEDVNDSTVYWLDRNGRISNSTPSNGAFFPWAWIKENYPYMTGLNIMDGLGVSGIYDAFGNANAILDPTSNLNSRSAFVNPREINGVRGIGVWSDNQMASNDRIQIWGLQEDFEY